ncbi:glycosyltransferase family 2 protein [Henriciella sp. AS95]|uniref:glycosyltransferase family 2 protein n=1 Tax=Henriciella sp. AS95 TaxID=3135782 RepID=UPI00317E1F70
MGLGNEKRANVVRLKPGGVPAVPAQTAIKPGTVREALARSEILPPSLTAKTLLSRLQAAGLVVLAGALVASLFFWLSVTVTLMWAFAYAVFAMIIFWRTFLTLLGAKLRFFDSGQDEEDLRDELPVYSILIALRHEVSMVDQLARNLSAIDWPDHKLDIILLVEEDDPQTLEAALRSPMPGRTRVMTVPPGEPMTKPRALNFGLAFAVGEFVTIYDAEDRPEPSQLKDALRAFDKHGPRTVCVQAPLVSTNSSAGFVAAHWSLEYRVQFGLLVPAIARLWHPVMLGGTSNHFRRRDLIAMGAWDAWNVTEDADLGIRIGRMGGLTASISTPTYEQGPHRLGIWLAQRSRWIKGYIQSWIVAMRSPRRLMSELGLIRWITLNLMLGGALLSAVLYGPMTVIVLLGLIVPGMSADLLSLGLFGTGYFCALFADVMAPGRWTWSRLVAIVTRPLYWPLHSIAAVRAIWGLAIKPSFWAKTPHTPETLECETQWPPGSSLSSPSSSSDR